MLPAPRSPWEISDMADTGDLRGRALYDALMRLKPSSLAETEWASQAGVNRGFFTNLKSSDIAPRSDTLRKLLRHVGATEADLYAGQAREPDLPTPPPETEYLPVEVLPTFAGMGGGGTGDGDRQTALIPRALIVDVLRGKPADFLLIDVRGDSMEPDFRHGDQILVDRRDTSPAQPGPFALWDGEWGEYVVKNVERSRVGEVRIFSSNPKYQAENAGSENTRIIGRPVWFGRRL